MWCSLFALTREFAVVVCSCVIHRTSLITSVVCFFWCFFLPCWQIFLSSFVSWPDLRSCSLHTLMRLFISHATGVARDPHRLTDVASCRNCYVLRSTAFGFPLIPRINLWHCVRTWTTRNKRTWWFLICAFPPLVLLQLSKYIILTCCDGQVRLAFWHLSKRRIIPSISVSFR